jgi:transaldolase
VSRIDTAVDKELDKINLPELKGKIAVANARKAYQVFEELIASKHWLALVEKGARIQRLLWASTGTKNTDYSDTLYIDELIESQTVNTVPPATLNAWLEHGSIHQLHSNRFADAGKYLKKLKLLNIDLKMITDQLQTAGLESFTTAFENLLNSVHLKTEKFMA